MPEQVLDVAGFDALLEEVGGDGDAEGVTREFFRQARLLHAPPEHAADVVGAHRVIGEPVLSADRAAKKDHFKVRDSAAVKSQVYKETGLDGDLLDKYGAKIARDFDFKDDSDYDHTRTYSKIAAQVAGILAEEYARHAQL